MRNRINTRFTLVELLVGLTILGIGVGSLGGGCSHLSRDTYRATVTEKTVKRYKDRDKYMVFTKLENGSTRVFENTDSILELKWNSSDIQAQVETGKTYDFKVYGWRIPFFSSYENILNAEEVEQ